MRIILLEIAWWVDGTRLRGYLRNIPGNHGTRNHGTRTPCLFLRNSRLTCNVCLVKTFHLYSKRVEFRPAVPSLYPHCTLTVPQLYPHCTLTIPPLSSLYPNIPRFTLWSNSSKPSKASFGNEINTTQNNVNNNLFKKQGHAVKQYTCIISNESQSFFEKMLTVP